MHVRNQNLIICRPWNVPPTSKVAALCGGTKVDSYASLHKTTHTEKKGNPCLPDCEEVKYSIVDSSGYTLSSG